MASDETKYEAKEFEWPPGTTNWCFLNVGCKITACPNKPPWCDGRLFARVKFSDVDADDGSFFR